MSALCDGRVVVVTGAGRGLGRAHALAFAAQGARVVVNDLDVALDGTPDASRSTGDPASGAPAPDPGGAAAAVAAEIRAAGGDAIAHGGDIATTEGAASLVTTALHAYGRLDTLVNNAGFLRDRMLVNLDEDDWDAVLRVHLKGHFLTLRHAAAHWRAEAKAGRTPAARVVNTSSGAGLLGSLGQANYSAAKAGIVALTLVAAAELARYGVHVNAIAPAARTRMTRHTFAETMTAPAAGFDAMAPENVSPSSSGSAPPRARASPDASSRPRAAASPSWTAGAPARPPTTAPAAPPPRPGRPSAHSSPTPHPRPGLRHLNTGTGNGTGTGTGTGTGQGSGTGTGTGTGTGQGRPPAPHTGPPPPTPQTKHSYVSHSSTVRHNPHRARTRPCTGTRIRW